MRWPSVGMPTAYLSMIEQKGLRPTHAAGFTLRWPANARPPQDGDRLTADFLNDVVRADTVLISPKQRVFVSTLSTGSPIHSARVYGARRCTAEGLRDEPNCYSVLFYAVSSDDAREMAKAYVRFAPNSYERNLDFAARQVRQTEEMIAARKKRTPELEELLKTSQASLKELKKKVPYRTDEEAEAAIGELDRMLNAARVDIAGIRAKIEAIQQYPADKRTPAVVSKLEVMFVEEAIALREAEARTQEATDLRSQAAKLIDLNETIADATKEKDEAVRMLRDLPQQLPNQNAKLTQVKERRPEVLDDKIFVYSIGD